MHFLKWRSRKKNKTQQNGRRSHSPINPITIVGTLATPAATNLLPQNNEPKIIEDDDSSGPYAPSQSTTIVAKSQITSISKRNGEIGKNKPKRKTSRVSFQLGPAIVPNDLPHKTQSECGTVSSARFPKPSLKATNSSQTQPPPIIENFDYDNYISYVLNVKKIF